MILKIDQALTRLAGIPAPPVWIRDRPCLSATPANAPD
jgi:hypothetical protein